MRLDNLLAKRWSRNATLVQGLVALDIIEELGFGLDRMVAVMAEAGLPAPVFANHGDTFVVTLYGAAAQLRHTLIPPEHEERSQADQDARRPLSQAERQAWLLEYVRTKGPLSPRVYVAALGVERRTALRDFQALEERGLIEAHGTTKNRRYTLRVQS